MTTEQDRQQLEQFRNIERLAAWQIRKEQGRVGSPVFKQW